MEAITLYNGRSMPAMMFGSFQMADDSQMYAVVEAAAEHGVLGFDTSPSYRTEVELSQAIRRCIEEHPQFSREDFFLESKIDAWQMIAKDGDIRPFVKATLKKIGQTYFDCLLIHWPQPDFFLPTWKSMEKVYEEGLVRSIGVCNCQLRHLKQLESGASLRPMVVQNEIHPFHTDDAVVEYCHRAGIAVQAYSPLFRMLPELTGNELLAQLAEKYARSPAQIVLRWHMERGIVPIVKTSKPGRVPENVAAADFTLDPADTARITALDRNFKIFLESRCCPGY